MTEKDALHAVRHWRWVQANACTAHPEMQRLLEERVRVAGRLLESVRATPGRGVSENWGEILGEQLGLGLAAAAIERQIVSLRVSLDEENR